MKKFDGYFVVEDSDIGFPRFTSLRRQLEEYDGYVTEVYRKMCAEFGITNYPKIYTEYMLNSKHKTLPAVATCSPRGHRNSEEIYNISSIDSFAIRIDMAVAKRHDQQIYIDAIPHEVCHAIHFLLDWDECCDDSHGNAFKDLLKIVKKLFPETKPDVGFAVPDIDEFIRITREDAIMLFGEKIAE